MICRDEIKMSVSEIGGKALNLAHLSKVDVTVPEWTVLPSSIFFDFLGDDMAEYVHLLDDYTDDCREKITELISRRNFTNKTKKEIMEKVSSLFGVDDLVAVRSSATDEDGVNYCFAGMLESYLNVAANESILEYIKKCYISCFSPRVMEYRRSCGLIKKDISVAVIIQKMVHPQFSGVMFTSNPITNNPDETLISIVPGLGEKLVSGDSDSADFVIDRTKAVISRKETDGTKIRDEMLIKLYDIAMTVEKSYSPRRAVDIEFCIADDNIHVLQCRLITTYSFVDKDEFRTILDNSNIIESYSGVTTPLTYTFAKDVYSKIYRQTLRSFYVSDRAIDSISDDLDNMLAFYENKIYYRLNSWYKMTAMYPGYEKNKKYMEKMMGVKTPLQEDKLQSKSRMVRIYASLIRKFILMKRHSSRFVERFNRITQPYYGKDFEGYGSDSLLDVYETLEREILDDFITPIANDMGAMVFYGMLSDKLKKKEIPDSDGLISSVLSRQGNVESAMQSEMLLSIVEKIKADEKMCEIFRNSTESIISMLCNDEEVFRLIKEYIYRYGARTMDELKLETVTLFEDPSFLIETIKSYLSKDIRTIREEHSSDDAEKALLSHFSFFERIWIKRLVRITKYFVRNRESLRLRRTYIYSIVRSIFLRIGHNLEQSCVLESFRDIFFLTKDEITSIVRSGEYDKAKLCDTIRSRKLEYESNRDKTTHERMYFYGDVSPENALPIYSAQEASDDGVLHGVAGGGKIVEGTVKLVESPENADVTGYILMAKRTDPGWTVLFPMAEAIIIERGSILSHSAVVAREMGITLVAGVRGLTSKIKDGMRVRVDGINGTVEIIGEENEQK